MLLNVMTHIDIPALVSAIGIVTNTLESAILLIDCSRWKLGAIKMFTQKNGVAPDIIQGVGTDDTAFDHIVGRLQTGGWKYIKIESITEIQVLLFRNNPPPAVG